MYLVAGIRSLAALLMLAIVAMPSSVDAQVGCRNAAGNPVDWWIALKVTLQKYISI